MQESRLAYTPVSCRCTRYAYIRVSIKLPTTRHRSTTAFRSPLFPSSPINAEFTPPRTCPFPIPTRSRRPSSRLRRGTYVCVARRNGNIACILLVRVLETEIRSGATSFDRSSSSGGSKKGKERIVQAAVLGHSIGRCSAYPSALFACLPSAATPPPPVNIVRSHRAIRHHRTSLRSSHYIP